MVPQANRAVHHLMCAFRNIYPFLHVRNVQMVIRGIRRAEFFFPLIRIHHPFLLSDNRHYTFYVWNRLFRRYPLVPYLLSPAYIVCYYAWFVRLYHPSLTPASQPSAQKSGQSISPRGKSLLEALLLPLCLLPTLLPTPLLEPRYFLMPYLLLRLQINRPTRASGQLSEIARWSVLGEGAWYAAINWITMYGFLYKYRPGVGRFMW